MYKVLMFSAAYLDLPFSPLVALAEVVADVDMLDAPCPTWRLLEFNNPIGTKPGLGLQQKRERISYECTTILYKLKLKV